MRKNNSFQTEQVLLMMLLKLSQQIFFLVKTTGRRLQDALKDKKLHAYYDKKLYALL